MAVRPVKRVYLIAPMEARERVVEALQDLGLVHLDPVGPHETAEPLLPLPVDTRELERTLADLEGVIELLGRFSPPHPAERGAARPVGELVAEAKALHTQLGELDIREARLSSALQHLEPWKDLSVPVEELRSSDYTRILCGTLPERAVADVQANLARQGSAWLLLQVGVMDGKAQVVMVDLVGEAPEAETVLREAGFQPMLFPHERGTVAQMIGTIRAELEEIQERRRALRAKLVALSTSRWVLMAAYDEAYVALQRSTALKQAVATGQTVVIPGWAPADALPTVSSVAEGAGGTLVWRNPQPHEDPPVLLWNPPLVQPCEAVTNLYGAPRYREIDPTPYLAPFFVTCFGIAVGEAGYGIVLALGTKIAKRLLRASEGTRRLLDLLFYCGLSTFVAGLLLGSIFAIDFSRAPRALARIHGALTLLDPLKQPLPFLGLVLALGFLQVWTGVLINTVVQWKSGARAKALLSGGGWLALLPLTGLLLAKPQVAGIPVRYPWAVAAAAVFVGAGLDAKGVAGKIGAGLFALYGITGYFGDVLSYSRLFALGLATGVMASVINILAMQARSLPLVGWVAMALILVLGHPVNIAINALGAFVHSARLQFVEFFTKFFEGGGRRFQPFARHYRYGPHSEQAVVWEQDQQAA